MTKNEKKSEKTPEERIAYFEQKLAWWTRRAERMINPPKVKHAKGRVAHYEQKLADEKAALVLGDEA